MEAKVQSGESCYQSNRPASSWPKAEGASQNYRLNHRNLPATTSTVWCVMTNAQVKLQRLVESATQGPRRIMHNAAIDIQRIYRGHLARERVKRLRVRRRFYYAARKINNAARIWLQRREVARDSAHLLRYASKNRVMLLRNTHTPRKQGSLFLPE